MKWQNIWICCLLLLMHSCQKDNANTSASTPFLAWGFSLEGSVISKSQLEKLEQETKVAPQIIQFYIQWPAISANYDSILPSLNAISDSGAIPCITWEPMIVEKGVEQAIPYEQILKGNYNSYLNYMANEIKGWKKPLIIRLAQEMNLKKYHWGTTQEEFGPQSPAIYIKMFRYIVTLFKDQQVDNILWAFCPNVDSDPNQSWNKATYYYPGNQYVDLLGMDGYNWAITPEIAQSKHIKWTKPWLPFEIIFKELYQELKALAPHKPIIVFETASVNRGEQKKSAWLKNALQTAKNWKLKGIIWFQFNKEENWLIQQDEDYSYVPSVRLAYSSFDEWIDNEVPHLHK